MSLRLYTKAVLGELLYLYTPFCEIHDNNDGTYTVDYYITKKNKGVTTYTVGIDLFSKETTDSVIKVRRCRLTSG